jgi:hypothetical protein
VTSDPVLPLELASFVCSSVVAYFSARYVRTAREAHLAALAVGFGFLAASEILDAYQLAYSYGSQYNVQLQWLVLFTETYAYAFMAWAYYAEGLVRAQRYRRIEAWGTPLLLVLATITVLSILSPASLALPSSSSVNEYFSTVSLVFLVFIMAKASRRFIATRQSYDLLFPVGMGILAVSQYTFLIFRIEEMDETLEYFAFATRLAGLLLLLLVPLWVIFERRGKTDEPTV